MKKCMAVIVVMVLFLSLLGCSLDSTSQQPTVDTPVKPSSNSLQLSKTDSTSVLNDFAFNTAPTLYLENTKANFNYSPLSLYFALAVATTGSQGQTQGELLALLNKDSTADLSAFCKSTSDTLKATNDAIQRREASINSNSSSKPNEISIANSLWLNKGQQFSDAFLQNAETDFESKLFEVDYQNDATVGQQMGQWIAGNTHGTLSPALEPSSATVLSIINTIYFYSNWENEFLEANTKPDTFRAAQKDIQADFMNSERKGDYFEGSNYSRASIPLKDGQMVFILPSEGTSVQDIVLNADSLKQAFDETSKNNEYLVTWKIPKFTIDAQYDLIKTLQALGINKAFDPSGADFSGMLGNKDQSYPNIYINQVIQGTHIAIDENGVEASAFTDIGIATSAASVRPQPAEMILDRPFIYGIVLNGNLLFIGVVNNPVA